MSPLRTHAGRLAHAVAGPEARFTALRSKGVAGDSLGGKLILHSSGSRPSFGFGATMSG